MRYVIIGNSTAAVGCIEGIRELDKEGEILVLSSEAHHTYSRPLISYLLKGKTTLENMRYRPADFYEKNNVTLRLGAAVTEINPNKKEIALENGETFCYDRLLVATGSSPFLPPMKGLEMVDSRFTFQSLDDALALQSALTPASRVLIIGAGLIGLKCAEGIEHKCASITVVDLADKVLASILDAQGAARVQAHIASRGVAFHLGASVSAFEKKDGAYSALLSNGETVGFDLLVVAAGVRPNTALVKNAGGEVARGIVTDLACRTTLADVYAAGDCAQSFDTASGQHRVLALLPNAYMQGHCAGRRMAGCESTLYDHAIPMNAIGFFGLHMITAGVYEGERHSIREDESYKQLFTKDGLLCGYILLGDIQRAGIYTALIRDKRPLAQIDFDLISQKPQLMAFCANDRAKQLGGA